MRTLLATRNFDARRWRPEGLAAVTPLRTSIEVDRERNGQEKAPAQNDRRCSLLRLWLLLATQSRPTLHEVALAAESSLAVDHDLCRVFSAGFTNDNARLVLCHCAFLSTRFLGVPRIRN